MAEAAERSRIRSIANSIFGRISGRGFRAYSLVGHVGRISGREYWTPVSAYPLEDGYVIPVLYGRQSNWVSNAFAAGRLRLRTKGREYDLVKPQIIPAARALSAYPRWLRIAYRAQNTEDFVWARPVTGSSD